MSHRKMGQLSLAESIIARRKPKHWLQEVYELVDWERLAAPLAELYAAREGRPSYPPIVMLRALLLQQWHRLSDPELEAALEDRISFRQFAGLALDQQVPDHSTISRFRAQLAARGLDQALFDEISAQLERQQLVIKRGTLIDASLVRAAIKEPGTGERGEHLGQGLRQRTAARTVAAVGDCRRHHAAGLVGHRAQSGPAIDRAQSGAGPGPLSGGAHLCGDEAALSLPASALSRAAAQPGATAHHVHRDQPQTGAGPEHGLKPCGYCT